MADTSAMADIRGIDIDKLAKGFADEESIFKRVCIVVPTKARELRWYQKTSGFLDSSDTTDITASQIANTDFKARPVVVEQSWTRNTSYVRKYIVESPLISDEDIKDSDIDILATNVRDLVRAVANQVDARIYDVMTESQTPVNINSTASTAAWDAASGQDPIKDLMVAKRKIRSQGYNPEGAVLLLNPTDHQSLITWLISTKGASIPSFASARVQDGVVMELLGLKVMVSQNVVSDSCAVVVPQRACSWKSFVTLTAGTIKDLGLGQKIRAWEEGEAILTDPKAVHLTTNTLA